MLRTQRGMLGPVWRLPCCFLSPYARLRLVPRIAVTSSGSHHAFCVTARPAARTRLVRRWG